MTNFNLKKETAIIWLAYRISRNNQFEKVAQALIMALKHHNGFRLGGAPAAMHQLEMFHHLRTFDTVFGSEAEVFYTLAFLHDILEDGTINQQGKEQTTTFLNPLDIENVFGQRMCEYVTILSKKVNGVDNDLYSLDEVFSNNQYTAIVKLVDRHNNLSTMMGAFSHKNIIKYIKETKYEIIPRAEDARMMFRSYDNVINNLLISLKSQIQIIEMALERHDLFVKMGN